MTTETVGFVGLGLMGAGFTRRLADKGYRVVGFDSDETKMKAAAEWGVQPARSAAAVADAADIVLVCVINTAAVEDVALGSHGLINAKAPAGKIMVDHSTTELETTRRIAAALAERGMAFVDAPVSGGPVAARAGSLAIMAGGAEDAIARIAPVMAALGTLTHMGPAGTGQATKLVNQTIVLTNYCVLAEALRLAQAYGVDAAKVPQALKAGFAGSNMLGPVFPQMLADDFAPRGFARQVLKDLEMLQTAARDGHVAMPMASQALTLYRLLIASGKSELDAAAVVTLYPPPDPH
ncbi:MAG TPA: NAD(P)-dependent oxidoreductase [Pseudolabrys sp.]|nr:NAD(P)-dependent oxidoreductase [Pseudolabrys sp.]